MVPVRSPVYQLTSNGNGNVVNPSPSTTCSKQVPRYSARFNPIPLPYLLQAMRISNTVDSSISRRHYTVHLHQQNMSTPNLSQTLKSLSTSPERKGRSEDAGQAQGSANDEP